MRRLSVTALVLSTLLGGCGLTTVTDAVPDANTFVIFHNHTGPMCFALLDWLAEARTQYPTLVVEEYSPYEPAGAALLARLARQTPASQGVSTSYEYLPIVFFQGQAFSGFNAEIAQTLDALLTAAEGAP
jgi:hypothetical protein